MFGLFLQFGLSLSHKIGFRNICGFGENRFIWVIRQLCWVKHQRVCPVDFDALARHRFFRELQKVKLVRLKSPSTRHIEQNLPDIIAQSLHNNANLTKSLTF